MIRTELLPGVYELASVVTDNEGIPVDEDAVAGMCTITRDGRLTVFNCSTLSAIGYTGPYRVEGLLLKIELTCCSYPEMNGITIQRRILELTPEKLVLDAIGMKSKLHSVITWKRLAHLAS
jgi:hypothetical protein